MQASSLPGKKLGSHDFAPTRSEKLNVLKKINDSSYVSQGRGVTGPSAATKFAGGGTQRIPTSGAGTES